MNFKTKETNAMPGIKSLQQIKKENASKRKQQLLLLGKEILALVILIAVSYLVIVENL